MISASAIGRSFTPAFRRFRACLALIAVGPIVVFPPYAIALPTGGQVTSGAGIITQSGGTTTINQSSSHLGLNWTGFDIGATETVNFLQPSSSSVAVNRISDLNGTQIHGRLNANGQVFLINPNGILFGTGAQVNVGGLVASTLDLEDGTTTFSGTGDGSVINRGTLNAAAGGYIALLGGKVSNDGVISARLGTVALGAGDRVTLDFAGDRLLSLVVQENALESLAENHGLIRANGGAVLMSAGARDSLVASVVNNTGVIEARTLENRDGRIILLGGMQAGTTNVDGTLDASAPAGGDGGFIETSAAHVVVADTAQITTLAANGITGTWLIDPNDYTIAASGGDITGTALSTSLGTTNVNIQSVDGATAGNGDIFVNDAVSWSAGTTLTLQAERNIEFNASLTATGDTAGVVLSHGAGAGYSLNGHRITLSGATPTFQAGETGNLVTYTVINSLGVAGSITGTDLQGMAGDLSGYYVLGSDIDAAETAAWNDNDGFDPIGTLADAFTGTFDGLGHTITHLTRYRASTRQVGLFGSLGSGGVIRNVGLIDVLMQGRQDVGGLVGNNAGGSISNAYVTGRISGGLSNTGGLVGQSSGGTITNSFSTATVSGSSDVGGLVGYQGAGVITDSYATGDVSGTGVGLGGFVGTNLGTINNAYATGAVSGGSGLKGGFAGNNRAGGSISNAYATGAVSGGSGSAGGFASNNSGSITTSYWDSVTTGKTTGVVTGNLPGLTELTTANAYSQSSYTAFNFADTWFMVDGYTRPFLRSEYSTLITNTHQLQLMAMDLSAAYTLAAHLDLSVADGSNAAGMWTTAGFSPIGNGTTKFTGSFDGAGHIINNLTINRPSTDGVGLFGHVGSGGEVTNVGLVGGSVSGNTSVGVLVGVNFGRIDNTYATGTVSAITDTAGGLVGANIGGTISNAYATGAVSTPVAGGGLAGYNVGTITQAYATGAVTVSSNYAGGLVGYNGGSITQVYASGLVSGGGGSFGGLAGYNDGSISESYWDTDTTGQVDGFGFDDFTATFSATGLTTAQAFIQTNYGDFDFATTWFMVNGSTRPFLRSEYSTTINNAHQLQLMAIDLAADYTLGADIDASATAGANAADMWKTAGFSPIGNVSTQFSGTFDGRGHTISNLTINRPTGYYVGLFGYISSSGEVHDVGLLGGYTKGRNIVGSLAGRSDGVISDVYTTGEVVGEQRVGGLIGYLKGGVTAATLTNAYATGAVTGTDEKIGGLVGDQGGATITNAFASGAVTGPKYTGGLVGYSSSSTITTAYASGTVTGTDEGLYVGGLAGFLQSSTITNTYATGAVTGTTDVGGLVGQAFLANVSKSYATGGVTGTDNVGGLVGNNNSSTLTANFWDTDTTGQDVGVGIGSTAGATGLTTAAFQDLDGFLALAVAAGWDFTQWSPASAGYYPELYAINPVVYLKPDDISRAYADSTIIPDVQQSGGPSAYVFGPPADAIVKLGGNIAIYANTEDDVGTYGIELFSLPGSVESAKGVTYRIVSSTGVLTVTPRELTITTNAGQTKVYGDSDPTFAYTIGGAGLYFRDSLSGALARATGEDVDSYAINQGTLNAGSNYTVTFNSDSFTITPAALTITADAASKTYGNTASFAGTEFTTMGLQNGETVGNVTLASDGAVGTANVDSSPYEINASSATGGTFDAGNYTITYVDGALTVTPRAITVSADAAQTKVYGDADSSFSYTTGGAGLVNGDTLSGALTRAAGENVDSYAINQGTLDAGSNYTITFNGDSFTITPRALTITADSTSKTYGNTASFAGTEFTTTGLQNDETVGSVTLASDGTLATANVDSSPYVVTANDATGGTFDAGNYTITYVDGALTVTPRALTITTDAGQTKVYGDADSSFTYTTGGAGLVNGDTLSGALDRATGEDVDSYAINQGTLDAGSNYTITFNGDAFTITPAALTITADAASKTYGNTTSFAGTEFTTSGLKNGETVGNVDLASSGTLATANVDSSPYAINVSSATGGTFDAGNYTITYVDGALTVTPRALTITADAAQTKAYGDADSSFTYTTGGAGLVNGDTLSGALTRAAGENVDSYAINQGTLDAGSNYTITFNGDAFTITPRGLTITADSTSKTYGNTTSFAGTEFTTTGLQNGETVGSVSLVSDGAVATANVDSSPYGINASSATGGTFDAGNYTITYIDGALTVTPRALTITTNAGQTKVYGDADSSFTYTTGGAGLVNGDTLSGALTRAAGENVDSYAINQGTLDAGSNYTITFNGDSFTITPAALTITADAASKVYGNTTNFAGTEFMTAGLKNGETVGSVTLVSGGAVATAGVAGSPYEINASSATGGTFDVGNYTITYVDGALTVTPRAITVSADHQARIYGDANPALTTTVTTGNLVNGDTLTGSLNTEADGTSNVGAYGITQGTVAATSNYELTFVDGTLRVSQRAITIAADDQTRVYGQANPEFTYTITDGRLVNGDTASGDLTSTGVLDSPPGTYSITEGTLSLSDNYALSFTPGTFTIAPNSALQDVIVAIYGTSFGNPQDEARLPAGRRGDNLSVAFNLDIEELPLPATLLQL